MRASGERGQALPIVLLLVALTGAALLVVGQVGARAAAAARARSAADAAALAGAAAGPDVAREVARLNGSSATVVSGSVGDLTVTVRVDGEEAQARAVGPGATVAGAGGLAPELQAAISRATALLGRPLPIVSGLRTHAEQAALWARRATNPYPVAAPGTSAHERGRAIDVPRSFVPVLVRVAAAAGLCRPLPTSDPVHFEPCRPS